MTLEGLYTGGNIPYGYQFVSNGRKNKKGHEMRDLAIEPTKAEVVRRIFNLTVTEGYGSYQLSDMLNREGHHTHNNAEFQSNAIRRILKNQIYIGYLVNGDAKFDRIEALRIVSDMEFEMAQKILNERSHLDDEKRTIAMTNKGMALLSGNIFCAHCGCRLATSRHKEEYTRKDGTVTKTEYGRYLCYHRSRRLNDCNGAAAYNAGRIDKAIINLMQDIFSRISGCPEEEKIQYSRRITR